MRFRTPALSALAAAAVVAAGITPAYAATGTGSITFQSTTCAFTLNYAGGPPPAAVDLQSFVLDSSCSAAGTGSGQLTFGPGDQATLTGTVSVTRPISCTYSAALKGTYSGNAVTFPTQAVPKKSGSFLCPNPANIAISLNL
ncbi:hypothetical protein HPO96_32465 [Kribbella sandramycini]|uniref:Neocarzinostatin family protein n=1 Tax=Kribbella sandramycini TaxID=60450 RepID=A0A7Y4P3E4_9ACTN|nr:hypothetical protein [Kribbella sandramycini]MBB6565970.1 hypothetical protein [Kribbella sandramycini]NOL44973.1 hypothetical protein [Kribbella sandramycini]